MLLIAFYNLGYNLLFYTYGVYLAAKSGKAQGDEDTAKGGQWKKLLNPGVVACVVTITIFATGITMPESVCTFLIMWECGGASLHDTDRGICGAGR